MKFTLKFFLIVLYLIPSSVYVILGCILRRLWGAVTGHPPTDLYHFAGATIGWGILKIAGWKAQVISGAEYLKSPQPCVYVANHQSAIDVALFGPICPDRVVIIGKKEIRWIPFFGLLFELAGNLMIDRKNRTQALAGLDVITHAIQSRGQCVFVFPEGTRNHNPEKKEMLPFKTGAFAAAIGAQVRGRPPFILF